MDLLLLPIINFICLDYRENLVDLPGNLMLKDSTFRNTHTYIQCVCLLL